MSAAGQTTWYDFAKTLLEKTEATLHALDWLASATRQRPLIARRLVPISAKEFGSPTRRPAYSVLSNSRLIQTFDVALPDWSVQLEQCFVSEAIAANRCAD